jgi:hypothetical protein
MNFMNSKIIFKILCLITIVLFSFSCNKQLDVNQDPNNPTYVQGTPAVIFPAAVLATTGKVGGDLALVGGIWSQYFTQSALANQYKDIETYNMPNNDGYVNASYDVLFTNGLKNYQAVISQAQSSKDWVYNLMGTVMFAYTAEVLADLYDQIPFSQALQGTGNLNPKFDKGSDIYAALIDSLKNALSKDFNASTNSVPSSSTDLVFSGDVSKWKAFANTLLLKMYLRMVNANPTAAQTGITALYSNSASFLTVDASVTNFTNSPGLDNPLYEQNIRQLNTATNLRASNTFVSWLEANSDTRITSFFGTATPTVLNQGDLTAAVSPNGGTATVFVQTPTDPVEFISLPESYFLQAEADLRYFGGNNAQSLYNKGVLAAFSQLGLDGSSYVATGGVYAYPTSGTAAQKLQAIITQKWASCVYGCHGIEAFFEKNRTGYPITSTVYSNSSSYVPGQLVISYTTILGANQVPKRFVFPYDETSRNTNSPALVAQTTAVWWGL